MQIAHPQVSDPNIKLYFSIEYLFHAIKLKIIILKSYNVMFYFF